MDENERTERTAITMPRRRFGQLCAYSHRVEGFAALGKINATFR
jgi:hypothetical protein